MRGVVTSGMLTALQDLKVTQVVDRFYGCSSGAINLAGILGGDSWSGASLYWRELAESFVGLSARHGDRFVRMSVVRDLLHRHVLPADPGRIGREHDLYVCLTDMADRVPLVARVRDDPDPLLEVLLAGAWLPFIAGPPPLLAGRPTCDGYVLQPYAFLAAVAGGCTHVLALTATGDARIWDRVPIARQVLGAALDVWSPGLGRANVRAHRAAAKTVAALPRDAETTLEGSRLLWLAPPGGSHQVRPFTSDQSRLLDGFSAGYRSIQGSTWFQT